jgi:hypothetical protein
MMFDQEICFRTGSIAQWVVQLSSKHKTLNSNSNTEKRERKQENKAKERNSPHGNAPMFVKFTGHNFLSIILSRWFDKTVEWPLLCY